MTPLSTVEFADAYFETRFHTAAWDALDDAKKLKALNEATRIINLFGYLGAKTDPDQENAFPIDYCGRTNWTPTEILYALYEIAYAFADGVDPEREIRSLHVVSRGYSAVRTTYDTNRTPEHLIVGVPSALAWAYLVPFLQRSGRIKLSRVS